MSLTMNTYTSVFAEMLGWPAIARPDRARSRSRRSSRPPTATPCFTTNSAQQFADFLVLIERPDLIDDARTGSRTPVASSAATSSTR